jgi:hypothetical protein
VPDKAPRKPPRRKKTWAAPKVKTGHLFESNSLACGKSSNQAGGDEECLNNPTMS